MVAETQRCHIKLFRRTQNGRVYTERTDGDGVSESRSFPNGRIPCLAHGPWHVPGHPLVTGRTSRRLEPVAGRLSLRPRSSKPEGVTPPTAVFHLRSLQLTARQSAPSSWLPVVGRPQTIAAIPPRRVTLGEQWRTLNQLFPESVFRIDRTSSSRTPA